MWKFFDSAADRKIHVPPKGRSSGLELAYKLPRYLPEDHELTTNLPKDETRQFQGFWPFELGKSYNRKDDIHGLLSGNQQSGIAPLSYHPAILVFTHTHGNRVGYRDQFQPDGSLYYTGEGQSGDMLMERGNKAILNHAAEGRDILVFAYEDKKGECTFKGTYSCASWHHETQTVKDATKSDEPVERQAIVFHLVLTSLWSVSTDFDEPENEEPGVSLADLRKRAFAAAKVPEIKTRLAKEDYRARCAHVRRYVLARADGTCEHCESPAPFKTTRGTPYLEAHHIFRLTDGGADDPKTMAGLCPNCHREAHHGPETDKMKDTLAHAISQKERLLG